MFLEVSPREDFSTTSLAFTEEIMFHCKDKALKAEWSRWVSAKTISHLERCGQFRMLEKGVN